MSIKVFEFSTFYVFFGFLTQKQVKIDKKEQTFKDLKKKKNKTSKNMHNMLSSKKCVLYTSETKSR